MLTTGYNWQQSQGDSYWQIEFSPYIQPAFYFQSNFNIQRLYTNQLIISMPSFTLDMYYSFLFSKKGQVCVAAGWDLGQILWSV